MKTKIISINGKYFTRSKKQRPLSPLMVVALLAACAKQKEGRTFGPSDIKRSFIPLIKRGLITRKEINMRDTNTSWQVTAEAITMLRDIGIEILC